MYPYEERHAGDPDKTHRGRVEVKILGEGSIWSGFGTAVCDMHQPDRQLWRRAWLGFRLGSLTVLDQENC